MENLLFLGVPILKHITVFHLILLQTQMKKKEQSDHCNSAIKFLTHPSVRSVTQQNQQTGMDVMRKRRSSPWQTDQSIMHDRV